MRPQRAIPALLSVILLGLCPGGSAVPAHAAGTAPLEDVVRPTGGSEVSTVYSSEPPEYSKEAFFEDSNLLSEDDTFLQEMTEEERERLFNEAYEDMQNTDTPTIWFDPYADPEDSTPYIVEDTPADTPAEADTETAEGTDRTPLTDEEAAQQILDSLPEADEIDALTQRSEVRRKAVYRSTYNTAGNFYRYEFSDNRGFEMSCPLGAWVNSAVALMADKDIQLLSVTKDGEQLVSNVDAQLICRETGDYEFLAVHTISEGGEYVMGSFHIVDVRLPVTISYIQAPEGYQMDTIWLDGHQVTASDLRYTELSEDGRYELRFSAIGTDDRLPRDYTVSLVRDTIPPGIEFYGDIVDGYFTAPVTYEVLEPMTELQVYYNGQEVALEVPVLRAEGNYYFRARDLAGNERSYNLYVSRQLQFPWVSFGIFCGILFLLGIIIILHARISFLCFFRGE